MIATHGVFRIAAAVLFAAFGTAGIAQTRLSSSVPFAVVGSAAPGRPASAQAADPEVFGLVPADPDPDFPYSPYAGAQLTLAGAGPQVQVTSVRLYAYALKTGVFQHISARFRFWNAYESSASPVFSKPAEFVVDLTACPCNFVAGKTYFVDVALPKPVLTESLHVGFSLVWETDAGDGTRAMAPVAGSAKMRGRFTMRAFSGAFTGTWITSMLKSAVFGSSSGLRPEHSASSSAERTELVPEP